MCNKKIIDFPLDSALYMEEKRKREEEEEKERRNTEKRRETIEYCRSLLDNVDYASLYIKWIEMIPNILKDALVQYHMKENNSRYMKLSDVKTSFYLCYYAVNLINMLLNDFTKDKHRGVDNLLISVYGRGHNVVYMYNRFMHLYSTIDHWNVRHMWNNCAEDYRLRMIIDDNYGD